MSNIQIISDSESSDSESSDSKSSDSKSSGALVRTNGNPNGPIINTGKLVYCLRRGMHNLSFSRFENSAVNESRKIINLVITGNLFLEEMEHLASPVFLKYIVTKNPDLIDFLKDVMEAIYICNQSKIGWFQYYDADVFSHISIFAGEEYEAYAPLPPYVDKIGSLHLPYFYQHWLKYYGIYQKLQWVIYKAAVLRRYEEEISIKKLCRKNSL